MHTYIDAYIHTPGGLVNAEMHVAEQRVCLVVSEGDSFNLHHGAAERPGVREGEGKGRLLLHRLHHRLALDRLDATLNLITHSITTYTQLLTYIHTS
jgi:hypothetical protein